MKQKASPYLPYPQEQGLRTGCKVSWLYFDKREDAEKASVAAKHNARHDASLGYDFGYCAPGSIELAKHGEYAGKYEVCIS